VTTLGPDYIDRTIATIRNHRDADNVWPQWANALADEVERLREERDRLDQALMIAAVRLFGDEVGIDGAQGVYDELLALSLPDREDV
jgi:hypothetical protein